jgi:general stress protein YciG
MADEKKGGMTVTEAGHKGGSTTAERYGHDFYEEIGKKGGKKGGQMTLKRYGRQFYEEIGDHTQYRVLS